MKSALIVGSGGQDGRLLTSLLLSREYHVVGIERGALRANGRADGAPVNILNRDQISQLVGDLRPSEIYYLAAFHHSSEEPLRDDRQHFQRSYDTHVQGLINVLEAVKDKSPESRVFYAASSHVFGHPEVDLQDEQTPLNPTCIYGITKTAGIHCCRFYRNAHGVHASAGILYNHESQYRKKIFVSQKIISGAMDIKKKMSDKLVLGSLSAAVDWGYAPDYVDAMTRVVSLPKPEDFVIATGQAHSVLDFVKAAFGPLGLDWRQYVEERPGIITKRKSNLVGNAAKLRTMTDWQPSVTFEQMVQQLLPSDGIACEAR